MPARSGLRAERKAGQLLAEMDKARDGQPYQGATCIASRACILRTR